MGGEQSNRHRLCCCQIDRPLDGGAEDESRSLTLEALADVDAGQVLDHQAVRVWAESLNTNTPQRVPGLPYPAP